MPTLEVVQRWAERYAGKLGLTEAVRVIPQEDCPGSTMPFPHCHMVKDRGTICWFSRPDRVAQWWLTHRGWKALLAHEVCHLKVKSHHSPYFARWMARLGFRAERRVAVAAGLLRHRHHWGDPWYLHPLGESRRKCLDCGAWQEGTIKWGQTHKARG